MSSKLRLGLAALVLVCWTGQGDAAGPITFGFDSSNVGAFTPLSATVSGVQATFSSPLDLMGPRFSVQTSASTMFQLSRFAGKFLYPNNLGVAPLWISFDQPVTSITLVYATAEQHIASRMHLSAFRGPTPVGGTVSDPGEFITGDTYPQGSIAYSSTFPFDRVELKVPLQGTEPAVAFMVDTIVVTTSPIVVPTLDSAWSFEEGAGKAVVDSVGLLVGQLGSSGDVDPNDPSRAAGRTGQGLQFAGSQYVVSPDAPALSPSTISVEAWVRSAVGGGYIIAKGANDACTGGSYALRTGSGGGIEFVVFKADGTAQISPSSLLNIWDGRWHFAIGTFDGLTTRLYIDGSEVGAGTTASASFAIDYTQAPDQHFAIGSYLAACGVGVLSFSGDIDEVGIWSGALSAADVAQRFLVTNVPFPTETTLTVNPSGTSLPGDSVLLTATVTSNNGAPAGSVEFFDGAVSLGMVALFDGVAELSVNTLEVGVHSLSASFVPAPGFLASNSTTVSHAVVESGPAATSTMLTAAPSPSVYTEPVALTAVVTLSSGGSPTGDVEFYDGVALVGTAVLSAGVASFPTTNLAVGDHVLTATYLGSADFGPSTSNVVAHAVSKAETVTTVQVAPANPSRFDPVTFTVTVTVSPPATGVATGTVQLLEGSNVIGESAVTADQAVFSIDSLVLGPHSIVARYVGTAELSASESLAVSVTITSAPTSIMLVSEPNPSVFSQPVTLTATVAAAHGAPAGAVQFSAAGAPLGTVDLVNGVATLPWSPAAGSHSIAAEYLGSADFAPSTSNAPPHVVNKADTATILAASSLNPLPTDTITLTASVAMQPPAIGSPSGVVEFFDGFTSLGTVTLNGGTASFTLPPSAPGAHSFVARFAATNDLNASESLPVSVSVSAIATTTTLVSSANPSVYSQAITLSAAVTANQGTPTGTVQLFDGSTQIDARPLEQGLAIFTWVKPGVGSHNLSAVYGGEGNHAQSTSNVLTQTVTKANTETLLTVTPLDPRPSDAVTLTATVAMLLPATEVPSGVVQFFDGSTSVGTATLSAGTASFTLPSSAPGAHSFVARFAATNDLNASESLPVSVSVSAIATTTTLVSSANPSVSSQPVTLTAAVDAGEGAATGQVEFYDGAIRVDTVALVNGAASVTMPVLSVGTHVLTAQYLGGGDFAPSASTPLSQQVGAAGTTTSLAASPVAAKPGEAVTMTASVALLAPAVGSIEGDVQFFDGTALLGSAPVVGGIAVFNTTSLALGAHSLVAKYSGTAQLAASQSAAVVVTVAEAVENTSTVLTITPAASVYSQAITLTATVSASSQSPAGDVQFFDGATLLGTGALAGGTATLITSALPAGTHLLTAKYLGNVDFTPSTSQPVSHTVSKASTVTVLNATPTELIYGAPLTLTATVSLAAPAVGVVSGDVRFYDGATFLAVAPIAGGQATFTTDRLAVGQHSMRAEYAGSSDAHASSSSAVTVIVSALASTTKVTSSENPVRLKQVATVKYTVTVSAPAPGAGTPTGLVTLYDNGESIGTRRLHRGFATFVVHYREPGIHNIVAVYHGSRRLGGSTSPPLTEVVTKLGGRRDDRDDDRDDHGRRPDDRDRHRPSK